MRRFLSFFLCVLVLISLIIVPCYAADQEMQEAPATYFIPEGYEYYVHFGSIINGSTKHCVAFAASEIIISNVKTGTYGEHYYLQSSDGSPLLLYQFVNYAASLNFVSNPDFVVDTKVIIKDVVTAYRYVRFDNNTYYSNCDLSYSGNVVYPANPYMILVPVGEIDHATAIKSYFSAIWDGLSGIKIDLFGFDLSLLTLVVGPFVCAVSVGLMRALFGLGLSTGGAGISIANNVYRRKQAEADRAARKSVVGKKIKKSKE